MMGHGLTDAERRVFQLLVDAIKQGKAALLQVQVHGQPKACIASYEKVEGKARLGVYGMLLSPEDLEEIQKSLAEMKVTPPEPAKESPGMVPVPLPKPEDMCEYVSMEHKGFTLHNMVEAHGRKIDLSSMASSDMSTDFEEFVSRLDGKRYTVASLLQMFTDPSDEDGVLDSGVCPFCKVKLANDARDGIWWSCPSCGAAWAMGGRFRYDLIMTGKDE